MPQRLARTQPTEWQRIGNQINAAMIFARSNSNQCTVVSALREVLESLSLALEFEPAEH
jgi:hypothetical protein